MSTRPSTPSVMVAEVSALAIFLQGYSPGTCFHDIVSQARLHLPQCGNTFLECGAMIRALDHTELLDGEMEDEALPNSMYYTGNYNGRLECALHMFYCDFQDMTPPTKWSLDTIRLIALCMVARGLVYSSGVDLLSLKSVIPPFLIDYPNGEDILETEICNYRARAEFVWRTYKKASSLPIPTERWEKTADLEAMATDSVKRELCTVAEELQALPDREERAGRLWDVLSVNADTATWDFFSAAKTRELVHKAFMKLILNVVTGYHTDHDWSKDDLFYFVMSSWYNGGCQDNEAMRALKNEELDRHYGLERHHPEREMTDPGFHCSTCDIREIALDRMSRNLQFGETGFIDQDRMRQFVPKFYKGNVPVKTAHYLQTVEELSTRVQREWAFFAPG